MRAEEHSQNRMVQVHSTRSSIFDRLQRRAALSILMSRARPLSNDSTAAMVRVTEISS
jgi:hypothetical protein